MKQDCFICVKVSENDANCSHIDLTNFLILEKNLSIICMNIERKGNMLWRYREARKYTVEIYKGRQVYCGGV